MGSLTPSIRAGGALLLRCLALLALSSCAALAQTSVPQCQVSAVPTTVRSEGLSERLGDLFLQCSGYNSGAVLSFNLTISLPVSVTNRVDSSNQTHDVEFAVDYGNGFVPTGQTAIVTNQSVTFNGLSFFAPASGRINFRISNLRGNAYQLGQISAQPIRASLAFGSSSSIALNQAQVIVASSQTGLYATLYSTGITCTGSPLPSTAVTLASLFAAGTAFASTRLTEGFSNAFLVQSATEQNGTRFLVKYSGFPSNAHLYVPDLVAGSDALTPTACGDLGLPQAVGQYVPGSQALLLARVLATDNSGVGGLVVTAIPNTPSNLNSVSEVPLVNGAGIVVYEVVDGNPNALESAQFPTFFGIANVTVASVAQETVQLAPVSGVFSASQTAPIPRFAAVTPASDCNVLGDCNAGYFPKLQVESDTIQIVSFANGAPIGPPGYITVRNIGGGIMNWAASISYVDGSGWLAFLGDIASGQNSAALRPTPAKGAQGLAPGTYRANVIIDAGPLAGHATVPVVLTVRPDPVAPPPVTPPPVSPPAIVVSKVVNAATFEVTPLVAGSLGTLMGSHFAGKIVSVTFDGTPATLLYVTDGQINLQVPDGLGAKTSATLVVTVDGSSSTPQTVALSPAWPSIFAHGVLNQNNSENKAGSAAQAGSILQIFGTGIPTGSIVSVQIGDRAGLVPLYAAGAPGIPGVQQVNVAVPDGLAGSTAQLIVCAQTGGKQFCSSGYTLLTEPRP